MAQKHQVSLLSSHQMADSEIKATSRSLCSEISGGARILVRTWSSSNSRCIQMYMPNFRHGQSLALADRLRGWFAIVARTPGVTRNICLSDWRPVCPVVYDSQLAGPHSRHRSSSLSTSTPRSYIHTQHITPSPLHCATTLPLIQFSSAYAAHIHLY